MGKYNHFQGKLEPSYMNRKIHPIWRGVGFAFMILIPIFSYVSATLFLTENERSRWLVFPTNLILVGQPDPNLLIRIIITIVFMLVLYAILTFVSLVVIRFFAPPRYGPLDVPQASYRGKPYKR
ncbi:MAG TPA: hypothetical protein VMS73_06315 [Anaerolineaceae bacterium]|nr:hypothetical protein [Anaerolineaceae bacterium]